MTATKVVTAAERDANVAKALAEAEKAKAEARFAKARASTEEYKAKQERIYYEREADSRDYELLSDFRERIYRFDTPVNDKSVAVCRATLGLWARLEPKCDITIEFFSPGGSVVAGLALYDAIQELRRKGHTITTKAIGMAASMAGILLQAGDTRVMTKESWLLLHRGSGGAVGTMGEIEDTVEWFKKMDERILDIFYERSRTGAKPLTKTQLRKAFDRKDWWIDADDALVHGFVDEVA